MWVPFLRSFPGNEAHKLFSEGPKWGVSGGGQKVYVEKVYVLFRSPKVQGRGKIWFSARTSTISGGDAHGPKGSRKTLFRSRPGKPNQRKGQNEKFMNFAHFREFWCFSLGKQARFTLNFCSGMPLRKVHEPAFLWFGLPGPLLICAIIVAVHHAHSRSGKLLCATEQKLASCINGSAVSVAARMVEVGIA